MNKINANYSNVIQKIRTCDMIERDWLEDQSYSPNIFSVLF